VALRTLSEYASMTLLGGYGIPAARALYVDAPGAAPAAAAALGFPVVVKLCGDAIAHKTERDLVCLGLRDAAAVTAAASALWARRLPADGPCGLLVAECVAGRRELIAGVMRDPTVGPCVLLGLGGIFAEALGDTVLGLAPLTGAEARRMVEGLRTRQLLTESFRGEPPVDLDALVAVLVTLGRIAMERPEVHSIDVNPLIVRGATPIAVDALVVLSDPPPNAPAAPRPLLVGDTARARFRPLFAPRGIIVAGVSSHPGKFGFVAFHHLLRFGYQGELFAVNRDGADILGRKSFRDVADVPAGRADLVFICTPAHANVPVLESCHRLGVRAAFVASAGYGEAGPEGRALETELVATADGLGMLLAGPNGQGLVSTSVSMCAQIVPPFPPTGRIAIVSQSGNIASSLLNYSVLTGVGVSAAISCGNAAQTTVADYLAYFAADPGTDAVIVYLEGIADGARFVAAVRALTAVKPLVLLRGGAAAPGRRAAVSHTGALATDDAVVDGLCRQFGVLRAPTVEHAFEWAATAVTQPMPGGSRVAILTSAGGLGVLAADACAAAGLAVAPLPDDVCARIDAMLPARWSRNNPIDLAAGETRDTVPEALELLTAHPAFDAVLYLGVGIQANQAHAFSSGPFFPAFGLDRIAEFHQRQDRRYALAAHDVSERHRKPVFVATELVHADRAYGNAAPLAVREGGRLCYPSAHRAVEALAAWCRYAEFRREVG
jgi:acetyltransferase